MSKDWKLYKLNEAYIVKDGTHDSPKYVDVGYPLITSKNLKNGYLIYDKVKYISEEDYKNINKRSKVDQGDLLFAMIGTIGNPVIINHTPKFAIKNVALFKKKDNSIDFLKYFLSSKNVVDKMKTDAKGATQKFVSLGYLRDFQIPLPPLEEQQKIVEKLDKAFELIDQAKANIEQNIINAKELYRSFLVEVFSNDYPLKKWGEVCEFVRGPFGGSLKKEIFKENGYVVYEQKHAIHDHFNELRYFIDEEKFQDMKRFEVFPGDIIMSCSGVTLGRVAVVPQNIKQGIINQALLKLTPKNVNGHFLKHWLRSDHFQKIIHEYSGGAAIPNVPSAKILKEILLPCPDLLKQLEITNNIEDYKIKVDSLLKTYQQKLSNLEELRKSILDKAFKGELTH